LGVCAVIAESYERIHRSNLVGMGILPLQFSAGENVAALGLTGEEVYEIAGLEAAINGNRQVTVMARGRDGKEHTFKTTVRIDTPQEVHYFRNGGILPYVLRQLLG
jgi:aconitate hydratase